MKKAIYSFIYYRLLGWKTNVTVPNYDKCVICAAPHTTNFDLFIGKLFYGALGRKTSFMMKKEWFFWPLGFFFRKIMVLFSIRINFQSCRRDSRRSWTEDFIGRPNGSPL